jgi:toxin ParE1/3/4
MAEYIISEKAQADLSNIWNYTVETWSENQADRYMRLLFGELDKITLDPYHCGQSYEYVRLGYRGVRAGKHIIFYKILDNGKVRIIRILHQKMDYFRHL